MHQTTIRFGPDTWAALEARAAQLGVSAAQYVRDATLARLATEGLRATPDPEELLPERSARRAQAQHVRRRAEGLRAQAQEFHASTRGTGGDG